MSRLIDRFVPRHATNRKGSPQNDNKTIHLPEKARHPLIVARVLLMASTGDISDLLLLLGVINSAVRHTLQQNRENVASKAHEVKTYELNSFSAYDKKRPA